jgi:hypothetical protein
VGEDRDADVEDIPEVIEDDGDDEVAGNRQGFPYDVVWEESPALDVEPGEPFVEMPPFDNRRHREDLKGHYNRAFVGSFEPVNELDYFQIFFTKEKMQKFVDNTNIYGRKFVKGWRQGNRVRDTTMNEMMAFFAIIFHTGVIRYPTRTEMFDSSSQGDAFVKSLMNKSRFDMLVSAWHYADVSFYHDMDEEQKLQYRKDHPFYHAEDLMKELAESFMSAWDAGQQADIDEQSVQWKGRHRCRCYNPAKPEKWHFKFQCLNDSSNGYLINFYPYLGKSEPRPPGMSASCFPTYKLFTSHAKFQNRNHILVTDNWFTSLSSMKLVLDSGNHLIGTVRKKRAGLPPGAKFAKSGPAKRDRGEILVHKTTISEKPVFITSWMDNKPVMVLSSLDTKVHQVVRSVQVRNTNIWNRVEFPAPTIIPLYNEGMGGTDGIDQKLSYYRPKLKALSWGPRIYSHSMSLAAVNAFLIMMGRERNLPKNYDHLQFLKKLIRQLADPLLCEFELQTPITYRGTQYKKREQWNEDYTRVQGKHMPCSIRQPREEGAGKTSNGDQTVISRNLKRGRCMICGQSNTTYCEQCGCYLCIVEYRDGSIHDREMTCWKKFHTVRNFIQDEEL